MNRKDLVEMLLKVSISLFVFAVTCSIFVSLAYTFEKTNAITLMISGSLFVATLINVYLIYDNSTSKHKTEESKEVYDKKIEKYKVAMSIANYLHMYYPDKFAKNELSESDLKMFTTLTDVICGYGLSSSYHPGNRDAFVALLKNLEKYGMQYTEFYKIVKELVDEDGK